MFWCFKKKSRKVKGGVKKEVDDWAVTRDRMVGNVQLFFSNDWKRMTSLGTALVLRAKKLREESEGRR